MFFSDMHRVKKALHEAFLIKVGDARESVMLAQEREHHLISELKEARKTDTTKDAKIEMLREQVRKENAFNTQLQSQYEVDLMLLRVDCEYRLCQANLFNPVEDKRDNMLNWKKKDLLF
jgi:hypothetical protein